MRWRGRRESSNVEDRRGQGGYQAGFPGGGMRIPVGGKGGVGIVGLLIIVGLMLFFGIDPRVLLEGGAPPGQQTQQQTDDQTGSEVNDETKKFVSVVLADTEDVWNEIFAKSGRSYKEPELVLYSGRVASACGLGMAAMGPFYCPQDQKVYLDFSFFQELKSRFKAPGDFAQAYVIAHEIGHHVQKQLGIADQVAAAQRQTGERQSNALQVRMELQADCLAGVFANHAQRSKEILQPGDIDEALQAASAIGDDKIQEQSQGYVVPDSFTHGSSEMRVRWFKRGFESGAVSECNTFDADRL
ncbi:putative neutral zinc metallopeptidase [Methyloligella halotolerans]|uniref:Putative neutral zinc metallopeptidase n=1 Tax=Methyloligella halotolerans TaxID=1177755 RepID=A0A1E2S2D8_9HYPH|nr:neutral zinc metallopeptidase [Methyloligella halotolerans]ODA68647.1 putative neutral zinc metallopeptidase [Methyloligella halotolerans]